MTCRCCWIASRAIVIRGASNDEVRLHGDDADRHCCRSASISSLASFAIGVVDGAVLDVGRDLRACIDALHTIARGLQRCRCTTVDGVHAAALDGRFLCMRRADGAQVIGRLQAAQPGQLVGLVEFLARCTGQVDVQRLRLASRSLDHDRWRTESLCARVAWWRTG